MKNLVLALLLALSFNVQAAFITDCNSVSGRNDALTFFINNGQIVQTRIQSPGSLPHVLLTTLVGQQGGQNLYSIVGLSDIMSVDQTILAGQGGYVSLSFADYYCQAN